MGKTFGEMLNGKSFLRLSKELDYKTCCFKSILNSYKQDMNHQCPLMIYDFWLDEDIFITSTNWRSGRNEVRIDNLRHMREYKGLKNI